MMRPYTRDEFEQRLKLDLKLEPTDKATKTTQVWKTPGGHFVLVPLFDQPYRRYFDYHFNDIAKSVEVLDSQDPAGKVVPFTNKRQ